MHLKPASGAPCETGAVQSEMKGDFMAATTILLYATIVGMFVVFGVALAYAERRSGRR